MDLENLETKLIQKQNAYIQQLEAQIEAYQEKDKNQELLIENLSHMLELLTEELSRVRAEKTENIREEE